MHIAVSAKNTALLSVDVIRPMTWRTLVKSLWGVTWHYHFFFVTTNPTSERGS